MGNISYCQGCGRHAPVKYCEFTQGIGMLVLRTQRGVKGNMCRDCASKHFWSLTGLTLVTGWWGVISFITNIFFIISNISYFISSRSLSDANAQGFPVQGRGGAVRGQVIGGPPPVQVSATTVTPQPTTAGGGDGAVEVLRRDVKMRLRGGETVPQIAQHVARQYDLSPPVAEQIVQAIAAGRA